MKKLSILAGIAAICAAFAFAPQAIADSHYGGHSSGHYSRGGYSGHYSRGGYGGHYGGGRYYRGGYGGGIFIGSPYYYGYPYYYDSGYYAPGYYEGGYVASAPAGSLSRDVQVALRNDGYYHGAIDGIVGPGTRHAIERFQVDHDLPVSGTITGSLLRALGLD